METQTFGEFIRELRKKTGKNLRQAAEDIGTPSPYLSRIESNREPPPSLKILAQMATVYKTPLNDIIEYAENRKKDFLGSVAAQHPSIYALCRLSNDLDQEDIKKIQDLISDLCNKQGVSLEKFYQDVERLKHKFPRIQAYEEGLFADALEPRHLSRKAIVTMAEKFLAEMGVPRAQYRPPTPIEHMVDAMDDVRLIFDDELKRTVSGEPLELGMSYWSVLEDEIKEIHINAALDDGDMTNHYRLRFTLAHEIFHCREHLPLLEEKYRHSQTLARLTSELGIDQILIKRKYVDRWINTSTTAEKLFGAEKWREWQANYFAACVLMPDNSVHQSFFERFGAKSLCVPEGVNPNQFAFEISKTSIYNNKVFENSLNEEYEVSVMAMAIRILDLGLITS